MWGEGNRPSWHREGRGRITRSAKRLFLVAGSLGLAGVGVAGARGSGMYGAECFVPYLSLTPVSNPCWRACCAEYFSRTAPGRWSVTADFAATSWGVGARACVMKIGSLFRYGYPCRGIRASVHGWIWGNSLCSGLYTRAHDHASQDPLRGPFSPFHASALCQCRCVTSNTCVHALS